MELCCVNFHQLNMLRRGIGVVSIVGLEFSYSSHRGPASPLVKRNILPIFPSALRGREGLEGRIEHGLRPIAKTFHATRDISDLPTPLLLRALGCGKVGWFWRRNFPRFL